MSRSADMGIDKRGVKRGKCMNASNCGCTEFILDDESIKCGYCGCHAWKHLITGGVSN